LNKIFPYQLKIHFFGVILFAVEGLSVTYPQGITALRGVNLSVDRGEILALVGESGCGKSTLGRTILGILPPHTQVTGSIRLGGEEILGRADTYRGRGVGLIFQDPMTRFNPFMTIGHHAREMLTAHGVSPGEVGQKLRSALQRVNIDPDRAGSYAHELSGGMRQRVMIALTLLLNPQLLIADEPTTSLDRQTAQGILQAMVDLCRQEGKGMVLISHDLNLVQRYCDRVAIMYEGQIIETDPVQRLFASPQHFYTQQLVESYRPFPRLSLVQVGPPVLEAHHLWKKYDRLTAVADVSFVLHPQEVLGIIGESGSGKSTTARLLAGLIKPDGGQVLIAQQSLRPKERARRVQMIFQDPRASLNPAMTIAQSVADPLYIHRIKTDVPAQVARVLEQVGLPRHIMHRSPPALSGGQLQRVAIARALILQPEILICDEPVSMLDATLQRQILQLLSDLQKVYHLSLVFITHDLHLAQHFCDRLLVMHQGKIVEEGPTDRVMTNPRHPYTQSLLS
jgi:peptide/nickel transport system ATP-binding protein